VGFETVVGHSRPFREAVEFARKVAQRRLTTVLIVGETGTGKGLFARGIHYAGPHADQPFVAVNCTAIPGSLLESELFGHERGAFTDARARKRGLIEFAGSGTLFLDEISELPLALQPKLLRALEERRFRRVGGVDEIPVAARIVAATNVSLEAAVADGRFREDLFYRLNVLRLRIPPLRERGEDVITLARLFIEEFAGEQGLPIPELADDAIHLLLSHRWPGNVRELKNVVQRAVVSAEGGVLRAADLSIVPRERDRIQTPTPGYTIGIPPDGRALDQIEAEAIRITLEITGGNKSQAARILGISRPTILRKIRRYRIAAPSRRAPDAEEGGS